MRRNAKFGVLSDQYIKDNYADCFLPISVDKLHSIRKKAAGSYVNTSGKRVKEYNSIAPVIPQYVAENSADRVGEPGRDQIIAIKSDMIRTAASAQSNYSILQPARKRTGLRQEDVGFVQISTMASAIDPDFGEIDPEYVSEELMEQAPLGASGGRVNFNTAMGYDAPRHVEDMTFAGKGAKPLMAQILDPSLTSNLFIASELKRQPQSALFAERLSRTVQQQQVDLLPKSSDQIRDQAQLQPSQASDLEPPPPVAATQAPTSPETINNQPKRSPQGQQLEYIDIADAKRLIREKQVPNSNAGQATMKQFLEQNLRTDLYDTQQEMRSFLNSLTKDEIKKIRTAYFGMK